MKLTKGKLLETIRRKNEGWTTWQARKIAKISVRRVNQVWKTYLESDEVPDIGKAVGRPAKPIDQLEVAMVREAYQKYRVSASTLEKLIMRDKGRHIPHNRIHDIMLQEGLAKSKGKKDVRKKDWIRYQRRHSLTAVHLDWFLDPSSRKWVLPVIDDASRMMLALAEESSATAEASISTMREALQHGQVRQCITDHGSQFTSNREGESQFKAFLDTKGIKQILCKIKHPQSNGKSEIVGKLYQAHRKAFNSKEEFMHWYNEVRPHRSLRFEALETPAQAFQRKMRKE